MITKEYFIAYTEALNNIKTGVEEFMRSNEEALNLGILTKNEFSDRQTSLNVVKSYIDQVKRNYIKLAQDIINENSD